MDDISDNEQGPSLVADAITASRRQLWTDHGGLTSRSHLRVKEG